jgi:TetR/AcrR family transcriptional regulator, transcriptional repressor for nem operon
MPADTRSRLVDAALLLFWDAGFQTTSLGHVCEVAGANPGSLYYFFPTKEALLEAALDRLLERIGPDLLDPAWEGVDDPLERVFALLAAYRSALLQTEFRYGCPIGHITLELRDPPERVREKLAANFTAWQSAVRQCLEQALDAFPAGVDFDRLATFVLTVMEGGVMQARTYRSIDAFDAGVALLRDYINRLIESGAAGGR